MTTMSEKKSTRFSVIVPTYNRREWVAECLDAILAQTFSDFEIIVVDDGSTDGTAEWIRDQARFSDVVLVAQENRGAGNARNRALEIAKGDLFVFIDSDDVLLQEHLRTAAEHFAADPACGMFACDSRIIDESGGTLCDGATWHELIAKHRGVSVSTGRRTLLDMFLFSNCFPGTTFTREAALSTGGFEQEFFPAEDYNFSLSVVGNGFECFYLHEPLCLRREHESQGSGAAAAVLTTNQILRVLERTVERNPDLLENEKVISDRFAQVRMDLALAQLKNGEGAGLSTLVRSLAARPSGIGRLFQIALAKIRARRGKSRGQQTC
jgi:cellulose synthase/poly-beta-1,6-N-acetylglucosamine synthase-like glycosyltransferase